jgi:hypothetical protein
MCLFAARDVWFVVSVPLFLATALGWTFTQVGTFMALWVVAYGVVQGAAPAILGILTGGRSAGPGLTAALGLSLAAFTALLPVGLALGWSPSVTMLGGLGLFGVAFALNSAVHSYLVLAYSDADRVAQSVGFYYMANATGRLMGTLLSGVLYQSGGVVATLWCAVALAAAAGLIALFLPPVSGQASWQHVKSDE